MIITKSLDIEYRIFTEQDISRIIKLLLEEYKKSKRSSHICSLSAIIKCADYTRYEYKLDNNESTIEFKIDEVFTLKKVYYIEIVYRDNSSERTIHIEITEKSDISLCIIRGKESQWVNDKYLKIKDLIFSIKPQSNIFIKHKTILHHLFALSSGYLIYNFFMFFISLIFGALFEGHESDIMNFPESMRGILSFLVQYMYIWSPIFNYIVGPWGMGQYTGYLISNAFLKLWPIIEFDFGPEHFKKEKSLRNKAYTFFVLIMSPFISMIIYDIAKVIFK